MGRNDEDLLIGWGEIADSLRVCVRTAKRYHYELAMPLLRGLSQPRASRSELLAWLSGLPARKKRRPKR